MRIRGWSSDVCSSELNVLHARRGAYGACLACTLGVLDEPCVCQIQPLWRLVRLVTIPQWGDADDSCLIYERATAETQPSTAAAGAIHKFMRRPPRRGAQTSLPDRYGTPTHTPHGPIPPTRTNLPPAPTGPAPSP